MGPRSPQLVALLRHVGEPPVNSRARARAATRPPAPVRPGSAAVGQAGATGAPHGAPRATPRRGRGLGLTLPSPRVSAVLVLVFLGFGVLLGDAAASHVNDVLTASRRDLKLVLGSRAPAAASSTPAGASTAPAGEAPESEAEATPSPSGEASPAGGAASSPSKASNAAGGSSGGSSGSSSSGSSKGGAGSRSPGSAGSGSSGTGGSKLPSIQHVLVIMLYDQPYAAVFGPRIAGALPDPHARAERRAARSLRRRRAQRLATGSRS